MVAEFDNKDDRNLNNYSIQVQNTDKTPVGTMLKQSVEVQLRTGYASEVKTKKIRIICPFCFKTGIISVDEDLTKEEISHQNDQMIQFRISTGDICDHEFSIHIDGHFQMR